MKRYFLSLLLLSSVTLSAVAVVKELHLQTVEQVKEFNIPNTGIAWVVNKENFPALDGVTCFTLEVWEDSMRLPHWHPNATELGYVVSGAIEIILWRSPGESSVFTLSEGMCWFIPQGSLHSVNNIGESKAQLLVAFSGDQPQNVDLPVAFNGIPLPLRNAYTSPHAELKDWKGTIDNPLFGASYTDPRLKGLLTGSPYKFDLAQVTPLFNDLSMGSVVWGVQDNWSVLEKLSVLRAHLKPGVARDAIWYPDVGTLYVVSQGSGQFQIVIPGLEPAPFDVKKFDYIFVPMGILHTFVNNGTEDFEVVAFFNKENPLPEVSLGAATAFFPSLIAQKALEEYGSEKKEGDPLKELKPLLQTPYLLRVRDK